MVVAVRWRFSASEAPGRLFKGFAVDSLHVDAFLFLVNRHVARSDNVAMRA